MASEVGAAWNRQNVVAVVAALLVGTGGTFGATRIVSPHENCVHRADLHTLVSEQITREAPWYRVEGQVMAAVSDVQVLRKDMAGIQSQLGEVLANQRILMTVGGLTDGF